MSRDWSKEREDLNKQSKFFKPQAGKTYEVEFLDEGGEEYEHTYDKKVFDRRDFQVKIKGGGYENDEKTWTLNMSGPNSLYGMLCTIFAHIGQSTGVKIHLKAEGEKLERKYYIKEYNELKFEESVEDVGKDKKKGGK